MQIGTVKIDGRLVLAPMAGVTDLAFRRICREHGAALTVTEMVSTKALCYQDRKTPRLLELAPDEHPAAVQIFGHEPETMAEGARIALYSNHYQHGLEPTDDDLRNLAALPEGALVRLAGSVWLAAVPCAEDAPFPLTELFCLARIETVAGRRCVVFAFDASGWPVLRGDSAKQ